MCGIRGGLGTHSERVWRVWNQVIVIVDGDAVEAVGFMHICHKSIPSPRIEYRSERKSAERIEMDAYLEHFEEGPQCAL